MPFDYTTKGWPGTLTLDGDDYEITSCDSGDTGIVYKLTDGTKNPHVTIHGADKKGMFSWNEQFHVRMSNSKLYEFLRDEPDDFVSTSGAPATGNGTTEQTEKANKIAKDFYAKIQAAIRGD